MACMMFDEKRSRVAKAIDEQCYGTVFCLKTAAHGRDRRSSSVFMRYARWRECQDLLSCWTGLALANEKEDELCMKKKNNLKG